MHKGRSYPAPIMQRCPVDKRQHCGAVNELLKCFPIAAKFADPTVC